MYKYRLSRLIVHLRKWYRSFSSITSGRHALNSYQKKAIRLWELLLKDETTQLSYNLDGVRQIEKEHLFIMFHPSSNRFTMTVMDISLNGRCLYEINLSLRDSTPVYVSFDDEMIRRMTKAELNKRKIIENDIDKLLESNTH